MNTTSFTDIETNKRIALDFLGHSFKGHKDAAMALLAPDATWWVLGNTDKIRVSGVSDIRRISRLLENIWRIFPDGMDATIEGITAEGDRVAVEASATASTSDGQQYTNQYHFLLRIKNSQIIHIREYMDTQFVYEFQESAAKG